MTKNGETHIRKVRAEEIEDVWQVHVVSSSDGVVRRGGSTRSIDEPVPKDARVALASDPDGGRVRPFRQDDQWLAFRSS